MSSSRFEVTYLAIGFTIALVASVTGAMLVLAHLVGPKHRHGPVKDSPYESGMPVAAGADHRMYIRFYFFAVLFLLFDVEVVLLWPWVPLFYESAMHGTTVPLESGELAGKGFLLLGMLLFLALLLFGLIYEWMKGALRWE